MSTLKHPYIETPECPARVGDVAAVRPQGISVWLLGKVALVDENGVVMGVTRVEGEHGTAFFDAEEIWATGTVFSGPQDRLAIPVDEAIAKIGPWARFRTVKAAAMAFKPYMRAAQ